MFFESRRKKATQEAPEETGTCNGKAVCCEHKDVKSIVPTGLFPRTEGCGYFWIWAWSHVTYRGVFFNPLLKSLNVSLARLTRGRLATSLGATTL